MCEFSWQAAGEAIALQLRNARGAHAIQVVHKLLTRQIRRELARVWAAFKGKHLIEVTCFISCLFVTAAVSVLNDCRCWHCWPRYAWTR